MHRSRPVALLPLLVLPLLLIAAPGAAGQEGPRIAHQPSSSLPFSAAVQVGDTYWFSGKLGVTGETRTMGEGRVAAETRNILEAFDELFTELGLGFDDVVKATVYLTDVAGYQEMNEVYQQYFPTDGPAREAVIVADLVAGASIEISFVAVRR
jgi:2-iminobutanoate/2-iminopropanoate deaminase